MQEKLDQIADFEKQKNEATQQQLQLAAEVLIDAIRKDDVKDIFQLIGAMPSSKASATDLILAIRDELGNGSNS